MYIISTMESHKVVSRTAERVILFHPNNHVCKLFCNLFPLANSLPVQRRVDFPSFLSHCLCVFVFKKKWVAASHHQARQHSCPSFPSPWNRGKHFLDMWNSLHPVLCAPKPWLSVLDRHRPRDMVLSPATTTPPSSSFRNLIPRSSGWLPEIPFLCTRSAHSMTSASVSKHQATYFMSEMPWGC